MRKETAFCSVFLALALGIALIYLGQGRFFCSLSQVKTPATAATSIASNDPRLTYTGPFENIHPDVAYVGSEKCAECHLDIATVYAKHPMARTLIPIADLGKPVAYTHQAFEAFGSLFQIDRGQDGMHHRQIRKDKTGQAVFELDLEVQYALGSGSHGHSFLSNRGGYMFQTAVSWFSQEKKWGISPTFDKSLLPGRPVRGECFFCHANRCFPWEGTENRYKPPIFQGLGIGCERCHGPGEKHVQDHRLIPVSKKKTAETSPSLRADVTAVDFTIVNPGKLKPALREAICQQCHLTGESRVLPRGRKLYDFRPGLPLESCWSIFVHARTGGAGTNAVNHVEQMYLSRCFQRTTEANKLGCISCHDPHVQVPSERRASHYRSRCLNCHDAKNNQMSCSLPLDQRLRQSGEDSCIECHMPRYQARDIVHNASTNHRILRRAEEKAEGSYPTGGDLILFHQGPANPQDRERLRDLGIALAELARQGKASREQVGQALLVLQKTLQPDDLAAWTAKAHLLMLLGRYSEALATLETLLDRQPNHEMAEALAASLAPEPEQSIAHWRAALAVNPWVPQYHANLARVLTQKKAWSEASLECQAALRLNPAVIGVRKLQIECLLGEGRLAEAKTEFGRIIAIEPANLDELKEWFARKTP